MPAIAVRQGSDEWLAVRRELVTATDIPVLLGISPYKCEADLADEKLYGTTTEPTLRMRMGSVVQDLIGEEYVRQTGRRVHRVRGILVHPSITWAGASPDFRVVGERRLVEAKRTSVRSRFADGVPDDIVAQVAWQLGVSGYPVADVAALVGDDELRVWEVPADPRLFDDLVVIAEDFRARLIAGGPFARNHDRIKRDHPNDDGSSITADAEVTDAVATLLELRTQRAQLEAAEEAIVTAVKARMGDASRLIGPGFSVTWKTTKEIARTDWQGVAQELEPPAELVERYTTIRPGTRPFRVEKEASE